jgi:hypothetical protein
MEIPDPKAKRGETVIVHNYRSKPKDGSELWEEGVVRFLAYECRYGSDFYWTYEIALKRRSIKGNIIFLYVGDDKIAARRGEEEP